VKAWTCGKHGITTTGDCPRCDDEQIALADEGEEVLARAVADGKASRRHVSSLPIVVTNTYLRNNRLRAYRRQLRRIRPVAVLASESQRLGRVKGYTRYSAPAGQRPEAREVSVYVRDGVTVLGHEVRQLTKDTGLGFAHDRWCTVVYLQHDGRRWAVFSVHGNASHLARPTAQNVVMNERLMVLVRRAKADGFTPVVGGDFNRTPADQGSDSPAWLAARLGMVYRGHRIDGVIVPANADLVGWADVAAVGSNHRLIRTTVRVSDGAA
jgi:hypothetical protein